MKRYEYYTMVYNTHTRAHARALCSKLNYVQTCVLTVSDRES